tara:strand:+ start:715 stop:1167 length:453 start_codon:yes stop_codon:yes gene_type:complete
MTEIKGWHVLSVFVFAFGIIIAVNLTLAYNAVKTFPGLEVKNSYVASQVFDVEREAQMALDWDVSASLVGQDLTLTIISGGVPIAPVIENAIFGRATSVARDQFPEFTFDGTALRATVREGGKGNWNLRLRARAEDGTLYQQRIVIRAEK